MMLNVIVPLLSVVVGLLLGKLRSGHCAIDKLTHFSL